jgi:hypothetical protein
MKDANDTSTLPLVESAKSREFCEFIGTKAFENDGGWAYEVWSHAWDKLLHLLSQVEREELANTIEALSKERGTGQN